jgi:cytochrome c peroxidase
MKPHLRTGIMLLLSSLLFYTCTKDNIPTFTATDNSLQSRLQRVSPDGTIEHFILPDSDDYAAIPQDNHNPLTAEKVALGKLLFHETGLAEDAIYNSSKGTYSCSSCHIAEFGFMPGRHQGIADGGLGFGTSRTKLNQYEGEEVDAQGARPLSMLNVAYVTNSTWSGKFGSTGVNIGTEHVWGEADPDTEINHLGLSGLESQNIEGLDLHRMVINREVLDWYGYTPLFDKAFSDFPPEDRYNKVTASFALSAYLRTLLPTEAPFQQWLKGNTDAMTESEKRGAVLFYGKAGCYSCHSGPSLSNTDFYAIGVDDLYQMNNTFRTSEDDVRNLGRGGFTERPEDMFKFKIPQLYNLKNSPFYFHGSSKNSLKEVVEYFNDGIAENPNVPAGQLAPQFVPLNMTEDEVEDLTQFLKHGLYDKNLQRYVPEEVLSGNCFPNNDPLSKIETGCE